MNLDERNQNMRDFFNQKIASYDEVHSKFMNTKKQIAENLNSNVEKILDLGVGTGLELIYVFEKFPNARVTAIDISKNMLLELSKRDFADKVTSICGDFFKVDFGKNYDAVISTSALHHFIKEDKIKLYEKIYNCLKDNGVFINADKVASNLEEEKQSIAEYYNQKDVKAHIDTPLSKETEVELLKSVGFFDVAIKEADASNYKVLVAKR